MMKTVMKIINFLTKIFCGKNHLKSEPEHNMKKFLIVGLGNMGPDYVGTRHNIGFMVVDKLAADSGATFTSCRYGDMATVRVKNCELKILKPSTFMNLSGVAVRYWMNKEKLPLDQLLVVVDDIALPPGTIRLRERGSEGGHNGLRSISEQLGNKNYARLRIGVGNDFQKGGQADYVLSQFDEDEKKILNEKVMKACDAVKAFCLSGASFAMTHYNG